MAGLFDLSLSAPENYKNAFPLYWAIRPGNKLFSPYLTYSQPILSAATTKDMAYTIPFPVPRKVRFDGVGVWGNTTGSDTNIGLSIFNDDGQLYPSTKIADLGTFILNVLGINGVEIDLTLNPGFYWLYMIRTGAAATSLRFSYQYLQLLGYPNVTAYSAIGYYKVFQPWPAPDVFPDSAAKLTTLWLAYLQVAEVF